MLFVRKQSVCPISVERNSEIITRSNEMTDVGYNLEIFVCVGKRVGDFDFGHFPLAELENGLIK